MQGLVLVVQVEGLSNRSVFKDGKGFGADHVLIPCTLLIYSVSCFARSVLSSLW